MALQYSTYMTLVNKLLARFGEIPLNQATFSAAVGIQQAAVFAVADAFRRLNQVNWLWPFNYIDNDPSNIITLALGVNEYSYPTLPGSRGTQDIDLKNVYIQPSTTLGVSATRLVDIGHDQYKRYLRVTDMNATQASQYSIPKWCYRTPGGLIGVSPKPNKLYTISVPYWQIPPIPALYNDVTVIDDRFDDVLVDGGEPYLYAFRKDEAQRKAAEDRFEAGMKRLRALLINKNDDMESTTVQKPAGRSILYLSALAPGT